MLRKIEIGCAVALVIITGAYTIVAGRTLTAIKDQNKTALRAVKTADDTLNASKAQFALDERPWLYILDGSLKVTYGTDRLSGFFAIKNFGKTPAMHVVASAMTMGFGPRWTMIYRPEIAWGKMLESNQNNVKRVTILPQGQLELIHIRLPYGIGGLLQGGFGKAGYAYNTVGSWVEVGQIFYQDTSGNKYRTDYCIFNFGHGDIAPCHGHNQML